MKSEMIPLVPKSLLLPVIGRDHIQGHPHAPIKLIEYGDYECPACGGVYPIIKAVQTALGSRMCFAFRNFPLVTMHPYAQHAAEAAEAAGAQGNFWEMHDLLFENQEALADSDFFNYASILGLDADRLLNEVISDAYLERVREDFRSGARSGVNGTPTLFINGARFDDRLNVNSLLAALKVSDTINDRQLHTGYNQG
jgi:protein-disulfide isomerase